MVERERGSVEWTTSFSRGELGGGGGVGADFGRGRVVNYYKLKF